MARRVKAQGVNPGLPRRVPLDGAARVATFSPGEPVPEAEYVRLLVPASASDHDAAEAERAARANARAVKVVREPRGKVVAGKPREFGGFDQRPLRQVVEQRAARAEGVSDKAALLRALDELLTEQGL